MTKNRNSRKARQLPPKALGVSKWQRDFWIALIEHAQSGKLGPPDLSRLKGFENPAVTRHAVTTLDLWHGFDRCNARKPYNRQVRPFGFMVMFQQEESTEEAETTPSGKRSRKRAPTILRVIAPFNRDPAKAAKQAFDRDTGKPVSPKQLKTYIRALRHYHDHPEAKFLNGERGDRGPTMRRHVIARSIRFIGKEANRLDDQVTTGIDPDAQAEFGDGGEHQRKRIAAIRTAIAKFGVVAIAREARISRQHISSMFKGDSAPTHQTLARIEQALGSLDAARSIDDIESGAALDRVRHFSERIGLRQAAHFLGINPGHLSKILSGLRPLSKSNRPKIEALDD